MKQHPGVEVFNEAEHGQSVDFPFSEIDEQLGYPPESAAGDHHGKACEVLRKIFAWVYQPPCKDVDGFTCRALIACWIFCEELRPNIMQEMAARHGKKKQSLGRWVDHFKREFPELVKHLQHIRASKV